MNLMDSRMNKTRLLAVLACALGCNACSVLSVAGTAVATTASVAGTVVSTGASVAGTVVSTSVDVGAAAVRGVAHAVTPD
jgi:MinD superfamily P-loop ATPase